MKASLLSISGLVLAVLLVSTAVVSQNSSSSPQDKSQKVIELKATKAPASRGSKPDANIKNDKQTNDPNAKGTPPSSKGGGATRGGGNCEVRLDNWTNYLIKIYVDGIYRGVLDRYGNAVVYVGVGETRVYGRADFDDGSYLYWGPKTYDCGSNQYIYFKMTE
ncbi:MAG TPA: hypothetical protein VJS64_05335 [Pyrinomonadaceae bacterium]|nr:hypothetical protein [Pyrinomonadaceae bacterium]